MEEIADGEIIQLFHLEEELNLGLGPKDFLGWSFLRFVLTDYFFRRRTLRLFEELWDPKIKGFKVWDSDGKKDVLLSPKSFYERLNSEQKDLFACFWKDLRRASRLERAKERMGQVPSIPEQEKGEKVVVAA